MSDGGKTAFWWIVGIIIVLSLMNDSSPSYDGCYDADPTYYTDMVCE